MKRNHYGIMNLSNGTCAGDVYHQPLYNNGHRWAFNWPDLCQGAQPWHDFQFGNDGVLYCIV